MVSAYGAMFIGSTEPFGPRLIWNSHAPSKATEMMDHIPLGCVISCEVWDRILSRLGLIALVAHGNFDFFVRWS